MTNKQSGLVDMGINVTDVVNISPTDIGRNFRFYDWDVQREIGHVITAELRQISANAAEITLTFGINAEKERTFQYGEVVRFDPMPDYSDVVELRQAMYDFHGIEGDTL